MKPKWFCISLRGWSRRHLPPVTTGFPSSFRTPRLTTIEWNKINCCARLLQSRVKLNDMAKTTTTMTMTTKCKRATKKRSRFHWKRQIDKWCQWLIKTLRHLKLLFFSFSFHYMHTHIILYNFFCLVLVQFSFSMGIDTCVFLLFVTRLFANENLSMANPCLKGSRKNKKNTGGEDNIALGETTHTQKKHPKIKIPTIKEKKIGNQYKNDICIRIVSYFPSNQLSTILPVFLFSFFLVLYTIHTMCIRRSVRREESFRYVSRALIIR